VKAGLGGLFATGRKPRLPPEVRSAMPGTKPLAAAQAVDGTWLVGTRDALHAVVVSPRDGRCAPSSDQTTGSTDGGDRGSRVWRWEHVLRAEWDEETRRFTVVPVGDYGRPVDTVALVLEQATGEVADLLALVRERVSASVLLQQRVAVDGKRGFRVFARRPPGGGPVTWAFELDEGLDPAAPEVASAMERALAGAKDSLGL
jgi:hypothetical protein